MREFMKNRMQALAMGVIMINLQAFAAGTLVNASTGYVNSETGTNTAFDGTNKLTPGMKTFYDTELLQNARSNLIFAQFGKKQPLPANKGRTMEWRKWNTLPNADTLQEGVIPTGQKMGQSVLTAALAQYGLFVAISDILELHYVDDALVAASEELGASAGESMDQLIRNELQTNTNIMYADTVSDGVSSEVTGYAGMSADNNRLTPDMVNKATTWLKKNKAPLIEGKYVAIIHPSVAYDLRSSKEWIEVHKYAAVKEIFTGEIGELHNVRFVETTNAKITDHGGKIVYTTIFLGKEAYGIIDPEGGGLEMIIKDRSEIGGPLEQFSTAGYKFEHATKILYPERMVLVESMSAYSSKDSAN